jgi:hypothetical protein
VLRAFQGRTEPTLVKNRFVNTFDSILMPSTISF